MLEMLKPENEAIAFRAWVEAQNLSWNLTVKECSELINVDEPKLRMIIQRKGWLSRFRVSKKRNHPEQNNIQVKELKF